MRSGNSQSFSCAWVDAGIIRSSDSFKYCYVQSALVRVGDDWIPFHTKLIFVSDGKIKPARAEVNLFFVRLIENVLPATSVLSGLNGERASLVIGNKEYLIGSNTWHFTSPRETWFNWYSEENPCYIIEVDPIDWIFDDKSPNKNELYRVLYNEMPLGTSIFFSCIEDAIDWWMGYPKSLRISNRTPTIHIQINVPLCPGLVRRLQVNSDSELEIELEPGVPNNELNIRLSIVNDEGYSWPSARPLDDKVKFSEIPTGRFVVCIERNESLYATYKGEADNLHWINLLSPSQMDGIESLLLRGENETCEFKCFGSPDGKFFSKIDLFDNVRVTLAGMANTKGGSLLMGVDDFGRVQGVESCLGLIASALKCETSNVKDRLMEVLKKHISDSLTNIPKYHCEWILVQGKSILLFQIEQNDPSIVTWEGHSIIYIRTGSTTRNVLPEEAHRILSRRDASVIK